MVLKTREKSLKVSEETWNRLRLLKIEMNVIGADEVILELLKAYDQKEEKIKKKKPETSH